jgi:beta-lactamase regulating signal transducer with metallopeptidase domain
MYQQTPFEPVARPARKRRRVFLWFLIGVQILFLIWIIAGTHAAATDHTACAGLDAQTCQSAKDAGATIGAGLVIALWAFIDFILLAIYLVVRLSRRGAR